ncbi:MAG: hypothetical protein GC164_09885 [Phycisphaera sp.]|nr:hypothetical protein [Phycisphaera sp.]
MPKFAFNPTRLLTAPAMVILIIAVGYVGYRLVESRLTVEVYRDRLEHLANDYEKLRATYNDAVRRTAVTELLVNKGRLSVTIRNAQGVMKTIETPYDPRKEVYVDYVLVDGRLWVRRVFDAGTPPDKGVVIDPKLVDIDWDTPTAAHGKAVYRSLSEGRWVITVSGDGALVLAKAEGEGPSDLSPPPVIGSYEEIDAQVRRELGRIGLSEVIRGLFAP